MMIFLYIFLAGLLGVAGHWITRWSQGRTSSTFFAYLGVYKARTLSSFFSILASSSAIYMTTPIDIGGRDLLMLLIGAYSSGYMLDSTVNKDKSQDKETKLSKSVKEFAREDEHKSIDNMLADDRDL